MALRSFLVQSISSFSDIQGDIFKARILPEDGNWGLYPINYCQLDLLNRILYVLTDGGVAPDFSPFLMGSPPILEVQLGFMPDGILIYYLEFSGFFDSSLRIFTTTGHFEIQNGPDYPQSYRDPWIPFFTWNARKFDQIRFG